MKVYLVESEPEMVGLTRDKGQEVIPFPAAHGFFCMSPDDMRTVLELVQACKFQ